MASQIMPEISESDVNSEQLTTEGVAARLRGHQFLGDETKRLSHLVYTLL